MHHRAILLLLSALATTSSAQDPALPDELAVGWINAPDAFAQMSYCLPGITEEKVLEIQSAAAKGATTFFPRGSERMSYIVAMGDKFSCIGRNGNGKPILPARIFAKIMKFDGASEQTTASLFRSLAVQLASRGAADALVKFANGNALELTLSVAEDAPIEIMYSTNFLKAGEFDETKYRFVVADQIKAFTTTSYGSSGRRALAILQDEIAPRPLKGDYLLSSGNRRTAEYAFAGTSWRFNNGSLISLADGGALSLAPKKGEASSGTWHVEDGALYINYGKVYGSATLDKEDSLKVEFRGLPAQAGKSERRWTATLVKEGV